MYPGVRFSIAIVLFALSGCSKTPKEPPVPPSPPTVSSGRAGPDQQATELPEVEELRRELDETRDALTGLREERSKLRATLASRGEELTALEEANASLELELASALEELLRAQASVRSVQSRALAVSRISEVRVELEFFRDNRDPALRARLDRADEFLTRADRVLAEGNIGGAAYLAERAGELVRQTRTVADAQRKAPRGVIPIVPSREMEVQTRANLRSEPRTDSARVGALAPGVSVKAVARKGDWFQVITPSGTTVWIHRALVR